MKNDKFNSNQYLKTSSKFFILLAGLMLNCAVSQAATKGSVTIRAGVPLKCDINVSQNSVNNGAIRVSSERCNDYYGYKVSVLENQSVNFNKEAFLDEVNVSSNANSPQKVTEVIISVN